MSCGRGICTLVSRSQAVDDRWLVEGAIESTIPRCLKFSQDHGRIFEILGAHYKSTNFKGGGCIYAAYRSGLDRAQLVRRLGR